MCIEDAGRRLHLARPLRLAVLLALAAFSLAAESAWYEFRDPATGHCVVKGLDSPWELRARADRIRFQLDDLIARYHLPPTKGIRDLQGAQDGYRQERYHWYPPQYIFVVRFRPKRNSTRWFSQDFAADIEWGGSVNRFDFSRLLRAAAPSGVYGEWAEAKLIWWERPRPRDRWGFAADIEWRHMVDLELGKAREGLRRLVDCVNARTDDYHDEHNDTSWQSYFYKTLKRLRYY